MIIFGDSVLAGNLNFGEGVTLIQWDLQIKSNFFLLFKFLVYPMKILMQLCVYVLRVRLLLQQGVLWNY